MRLNQPDYDRFMALSQRVGEWSKTNFAAKSKLGNHRMLEPLLGIVEEIGELEEARSKEAVADALGDIVIYLADLTYQAKITLRYYPGRKTGSALGRMFRAVLKHLQGIRGYDDEAKYRSEFEYWASIFLWELCDGQSTDCISLAEKVFDGVVAKRNWVTNPEGPKC